VVEALARANGLDVIHIADDGDSPMAARSDWLLLSEDASLLARPEFAEFAKPLAPRLDWRLWTDEYNNIVQALK
jgi:hypothetical protein